MTVSWLYVVVIVLLAVALAYAIILLLQSRRQRQQLQARWREIHHRIIAAEQADREREPAWARAVFDAVPMPIVVTNANKAIIAFNEPAQRVFGSASPGEQAIVRIRHHALDDLLDTAIAGTVSDEPQVTIDERIWTAGVQPLRRDDEVIGAILVLQDVTERVRLARARRDLAANLGHELRTPLTSMRITLETLQDVKLDESDLAEQLLERIAGETEAMIRLVEDLTTISLLEDGRVPLRLTRQPLVESVDTAVARLQPQIDRKQINVVTEVPADCLASIDSERFAQVLTNLLDNAVKYTPAGGKIYVRGHRTNGTVRLIVQDTGPGVPPSVLPRIFERFYKYDQARTRDDKAGTGIGLAVVKHLVRAHGGRVWAESRPGEGVRVIVELPAERAAGADDA